MLESSGGKHCATARARQRLAAQLAEVRHLGRGGLGELWWSGAEGVATGVDSVNKTSLLASCWRSAALAGAGHPWPGLLWCQITRGRGRRKRSTEQQDCRWCGLAVDG